LSFNDQESFYSNVVVFDQNSNFFTRSILRRLDKKGCTIIYSKQNVGMLQGWINLVDSSSSEYLLLIENDWYCNARNSNWVTVAESILDGFSQISFVKLRQLDDVDNYGKGLLEHQPWTISKLGIREVDAYVERSTTSGSKFFEVYSSNTGFTFNPILIRRNKFLELIYGAVDDVNDKTPLRSGENVLDERWRSNVENVAAVYDGPFAHTGFHNPINYAILLPVYLLLMFKRKMIGIQPKD
jgi:hypothetical protein